MQKSDIQLRTERPYSPDEAFAYCARIANTHYENFPVASLFLPEGKRQYIQAIYAFSRIADDVSDELERSPSERLDILNQFERDLLVSCGEEPEYQKSENCHPVFVALRETVKSLDLPIKPFVDLLTAFKQDVVQQRYDTFTQLLGYCSCSANPVGRLVLMIFGYRDEQLFSLSDDICTALQLTNFWQDLAVDLAKNRLYVPLEDMTKFEYSLDEWKKLTLNENFRKLMKFEVERTRALFYDGAGLTSRVDRDLQLELKMIWFGGIGILKRLDKVRYDVVNHRPRLTLKNKCGILFRGLLFNELSRYGRKRKQWDLT